MLRLSLRNFRVKPVRAVLTVLGMSIGFGVVLFLVSLGYGLQYILIGNLVTTQDSLVTMQASYPIEANLYFTQSKIDELEKLTDVAEVLPINNSSGEVTRQEDGEHPALISTLVVEPSYFRLMGTSPTVGQIFSSTSPGMVVTSQTLELMGLATSSASLGRLFNLSVEYEDDLHGTTTLSKSIAPVPLVGIIVDDTQAPLAILAPESLSVAPPFYQSVLVKADDINAVETVRNELLNQGFVVSARIDLVNQARQITNIITIVLGVFGITALIVSAVGMFNTMIVSFMERTYEVGILKSLGATDDDVRNLFLVESAFMGALGGTGGVLLGYLTAQAINFGISLVATHYGSKPITLFITPLWFAGLTIGLSVIIGVISGFWPARRASKLSPKEAFLRK
ncbi:MAG TPA: ABC transporter permease [Candidatus Paceibacterota bacterium]